MAEARVAQDAVRATSRHLRTLLIWGGSTVLALWSGYTLVILFAVQSAWSGPFALLLGYGYPSVAFGALIGQIALSAATLFLFSLARARAAETEHAIEESVGPPGNEADVAFLRQSLSYSLALSRNVEAALSAAVLLPLVALGLWVLLPEAGRWPFAQNSAAAPQLVQLFIVPVALAIFGLVLFLQIAEESGKATARIERARSRIAGEGGRWPPPIRSGEVARESETPSRAPKETGGGPSAGRVVRDLKMRLDGLGGSVVRWSWVVLLLTGIGLLGAAWAQASPPSALFVFYNVPLFLLTIAAFVPWTWAVVRLVGRSATFARTRRDDTDGPDSTAEWGPEAVALRHLANLGDEVLVIRQTVRGVQLAVVFVAVWVTFWFTLSLPIRLYSEPYWYPLAWQGLLLLPVLLMTMVAARSSVVLGRLDRAQRSLERWMSGLDRLAQSFWERY
ncbi:MAG: hypothetical protein L3K19_06610 [Thermoplasmata archaeon]|nr:hypothetical protein [Thermoplasmata archaeon]